MAWIVCYWIEEIGIFCGKNGNNGKPDGNIYVNLKDFIDIPADFVHTPTA